MSLKKLSDALPSGVLACFAMPDGRTEIGTGEWGGHDEASGPHFSGWQIATTYEVRDKGDDLTLAEALCEAVNEFRRIESGEAE